MYKHFFLLSLVFITLAFAYPNQNSIFQESDLDGPYSDQYDYSDNSLPRENTETETSASIEQRQLAKRLYSLLRKILAPEFEKATKRRAGSHGPLYVFRRSQEGER